MNRKQPELPAPFTNNIHVTTHAKHRTQFEKLCNEYKNYTPLELHASLHRWISPH